MNLSAELKCMSAIRKGQNKLFSISGYISAISAEFENELTQLAEPTEEEIRQMREKIEEAQKGKEPRLSSELLKGIPGEKP